MCLLPRSPHHSVHAPHASTASIHSMHPRPSHPRARPVHACGCRTAAPPHASTATRMHLPPCHRHRIPPEQLHHPQGEGEGWDWGGGGASARACRAIHRHAARMHSHTRDCSPPARREVSIHRGTMRLIHSHSHSHKAAHDSLDRLDHLLDRRRRRGRRARSWDRSGRGRGRRARSWDRSGRDRSGRLCERH